VRRATRIIVFGSLCVVSAVVTHLVRVRGVRAQSQSFPEFTIESNETSSGSKSTLRRSVFQAQRADGSIAEGDLHEDGALAGPRHLRLLETS
jgi:hypothetical protein